MDVEPGSIEVKTTGDSRIVVAASEGRMVEQRQCGGDPEPARGQLQTTGKRSYDPRKNAERIPAAASSRSPGAVRGLDPD